MPPWSKHHMYNHARGLSAPFWLGDGCNSVDHSVRRMISALEYYMGSSRHSRYVTRCTCDPLPTVTSCYQHVKGNLLRCVIWLRFKMKNVLAYLNVWLIFNLILLLLNFTIILSNFQTLRQNHPGFVNQRNRLDS